MTDIVSAEHREAQVAELEAEIERLREAFFQIEEWARAYPLTAFPKPDLIKARELLKAGDMTLDSVSADAMRHVVTEVAAIARRALETR